MAYAQNDQEPRHMHPSGKPSDAEDGREEVSVERWLRAGRRAGRRAALRDSVGAAAYVSNSHSFIAASTIALARHSLVNRYLKRHDKELAELEALHRKGQRSKTSREDF
ncbi:hypothetical protein BC938DRAFT_470849 [Jimgerdemannia flammicorona]|uniref:Uncharacterized protein n=1 Tax=Jimgerdemannia flammicorona TaxID=994334 RepID=A0A433Q9D9_9FUNG|nr:hypothetical protein BC938DRAFT_470849 [Jimgerdemannia flammicorona]